MTRRIAAAAALVLCVCVAPPEARAPRPRAAGWNLFAAEHVLEVLGRAEVAFEPQLALAEPPPLATAPEPGVALLVALGLTALGRVQRGRSASQLAATSRGERPR